MLSAVKTSSPVPPVWLSTAVVNKKVVPVPPDASGAFSKLVTAVAAAVLPEVTVDAVAVTPLITALAAVIAVAPEYVLPSVVTATVYVFATATLLVTAVASVPVAPLRI